MAADSGPNSENSAGTPGWAAFIASLIFSSKHKIKDRPDDVHKNHHQDPSPPGPAQPLSPGKIQQCNDHQGHLDEDQRNQQGEIFSNLIHFMTPLLKDLSLPAAPEWMGNDVSTCAG